ncbi:hypothetical protein S1OALGB6SA_840 [Olavius algarvensis spirochete endosymbiont]|nr:hypothetical protein S1OALGB6SA_840 [Olavius algarvensis spirochete endosymbiont]
MAIGAVGVATYLKLSWEDDNLSSSQEISPPGLVGRNKS